MILKYKNMKDFNEAYNIREEYLPRSLSEIYDYIVYQLFKISDDRIARWIQYFIGLDEMNIIINNVYDYHIVEIGTSGFLIVSSDGKVIDDF